MREREGCDAIVTGYVPGNQVAERHYESLGFRTTSEIVARQELTGTPG